jgi:hypothetical protein
MKAMVMLPTVFAAAWLAAGVPDPEKLLKEAAQTMQDIAAVLKTIRDKQSAETAVSKFDEPVNRNLGTVAALKKIRPDDPAMPKLMQKYERLLKEAQTSLEQEANRVLRQVDLQKILQKSQVWVRLETIMQLGPINRAKMDVKSLEAAVVKYSTNNGNYPETLAELTERHPLDGSPAVLTEKALLDPWGQPYIYEPITWHPQTGKPLIYSNGPPDARLRISNWGIDDFPGKK